MIHMCVMRVNLAVRLKLGTPLLPIRVLTILTTEMESDSYPHHLEDTVASTPFPANMGRHIYLSPNEFIGGGS
jgi:hypothetical protein